LLLQGAVQLSGLEWSRERDRIIKQHMPWQDFPGWAAVELLGDRSKLIITCCSGSLMYEVPAVFGGQRFADAAVLAEALMQRMGVSACCTLLPSLPLHVLACLLRAMCLPVDTLFSCALLVAHLLARGWRSLRIVAC